MSEVRALRSRAKAPAAPPATRADRAAEAQAKAMNRLADEVALLRDVGERAVAEMQTAKQFVDKLDLLCGFLRRWFRRLLAFGPVLLLLFNGLSPEVNAAIKVLIERAVIGLAAGGG